MNQHERNDIALAEWPKIKNDSILGDLEALTPDERVEYIDQLLEAKGRLEYQSGWSEAVSRVLAILETHRYRTIEEMISLIQSLFNNPNQ